MKGAIVINIKNKNGISLTVLAISIIVIVILSSVIVIQVSNSLGGATKTTFSETILLVEDQVKVYYSLNGSFPTMSMTEKMNIDELLSYSNLSDDRKSLLRQELIKYGDYNMEGNVGEYYIVDLDKLDIENSKLGKTQEGKNDVFFVCYPTMNVYYLKGIEVEQEVFFSVTSEFERITNTNVTKDTSVTTYKKVNGIAIEADNKIWSNRLGLKIEANVESTEELYFKISGVDEIKKAKTVVGENRLIINNLEDIKKYIDITDAQILSFNNYNGDGTRNIEVIKRVNGADVSKILVDYCKYDYVSPVMASEITVRSDEDENTCLFEISDGNGSGIRTVKYEYLTVFDDNADIVSYYNDVEDYEISYLKSSGKEIKVSSSGKAQVRIPKNVNSIQIYIEDNASNWTKTIQNVRNKIAVQIIPDKITKSDLNFSIAINSLENISEIKSYISIDGTNYTNEKSYSMASNTKTTFEVAYDNLEIEDNIYVKVIAKSVNNVVETVIKKLTTLDSSVNKIAKPILQEGMTPIKFTSTGKVVTTTTDDSQWYNYEENKWANAITKDGSYWVWIPRFEYKITYYTDDTKTTKSSNITLYGDIDVKFILKNQVEVDEGYTYIHPAFRDGSKTNYMNGEWGKEIQGFWVAKYVAGFQASTTNAQDATVIANKNDEIIYSDKNYTSFNSSYTKNALSQNLNELPKMSYPVFKPLTYAYNNISIDDSYILSKEIANANSFYGLNSSKIDSHMMKSSEWGAVAYLTFSKYGRNGEKVTINSKSLNNLNEKNIYGVTGYENDTADGVLASSTGNKTGVFDLSGCVWERVSSYISNGNESISTYGKAFAKADANENGYKTLSTKYVTVYPYDSTNDTNEGNKQRYNSLKTSNYIYGDAIYETSTSGVNTNSWNGGFSMYVAASKTFVTYGGYYGDGEKASIFSYHHTGGMPLSDSGFRAVLIPL